MRHGFERLQTEAFIKRWEDKHFGGVIKHAQHFDGNEAHEADIILHPATNDCPAKIGVLGEFIADDDELQIGKLTLLFKLSLKRRKCLNDAQQVLMRADSPRIKKEGICDQ